MASPFDSCQGLRPHSRAARFAPAHSQQGNTAIQATYMSQNTARSRQVASCKWEWEGCLSWPELQVGARFHMELGELGSCSITLHAVTSDPIRQPEPHDEDVRRPSQQLSAIFASSHCLEVLMTCGGDVVQMVDDGVARLAMRFGVPDVEDGAATDPDQNLVKCQDGGAEVGSGRRRAGGIAASALWLSQVWERHLSLIHPPLTLTSP